MNLNPEWERLALRRSGRDGGGDITHRSVRIAERLSGRDGSFEKRTRVGALTLQQSGRE